MRDSFALAEHSGRRAGSTNPGGYGRGKRAEIRQKTSALPPAAARSIAKTLCFRHFDHGRASAYGKSEFDPQSDGFRRRLPCWFRYPSSLDCSSSVMAFAA
jgi:hypothetical protein